MQRTRFSIEEQVGGLVGRPEQRRRLRRHRTSDPTDGWAAEVRAVAERIGAEARTQRRDVA